MLVSLVLFLELSAASAVHMPRIAPIPPADALDIGPILVDPTQQKNLLAEADRLGADVLVYESGSIANFYGELSNDAKFARAALTTVASLVAAGLGQSSNAANPSGPAGIPTAFSDDRRKVVGFYRAFRTHVAHAPLAIAPPFAGDSVDAQFSAVHTAFARDTLTPREYEGIRSRLLASMSH